MAALVIRSFAEPIEDAVEAVGIVQQQVPTRKRSQRPRKGHARPEEPCPAPQRSCGAPADEPGGAAEHSSCAADSTEEEEAAALLLGMGHPASPPTPPRSPKAVTSRGAAEGGGGAGAGGFRCCACWQPAALRGEKRPTFFCAACPSKGGGQKRAQRALHGPDGRVVGVAEAVRLSRGGGAAARRAAAQALADAPAAQAAGQQLHQRRCPPIFQQSGLRHPDQHLPQQQAAAAAPRAMDRLGSVPLQHRAGGDPDWVPGLARAASEGGGDANQGRCKCGKRISAAHPPCKSELMLLCEKFQARFGGGARAGPALILLNEAAVELAVPRRRLYDIINVLEAVEIVSRTGKLAYEWAGLQHLPQLLDRLVADQLAGIPVEDRLRRTPAVPQRVSAGDEPQHGAEDTAAAAPAAEPREQQQARHVAPPAHSLWMLSRKFVRLLLATQGPIPLAEAAGALIGADVPAARRAQAQITVERRLYDIGSILSSVGLIEKTYLGKRQPAFSWTWPWQPAPADVAQARPKQGGGGSDTSSSTGELRLVPGKPAAQAQETGCKTPSSVGASSGAAALKRAWSDDDRSVQEAQQPEQQADAKRARTAAVAADEAAAAVPSHGPSVQLRLPQLPPSLAQGMGLSFAAEQQRMSGLGSQSMHGMSVANMGWPSGNVPHFLPMPYGALAFSPTCITDMATMWAQHLPAAAQSMGTLAGFPLAPSGTFNPHLYGVQALQQ